jgi:hypothetical protein
MTEAEWLSCGDPEQMLEFLCGKVSDRKVRLFLIACARSVWDKLARPDLRRAVEVAEQFADGEASDEELREQKDAMYGFATGPPDPEASAWFSGPSEKMSAHRLALAATFGHGGLSSITRTSAYRMGQYLTGSVQPALLRDVFGALPFRPVAVDPLWRTVDVLGLARGIYEDRAFDRLPLLADALMDAGCAEEQLLAHCRSEGPHVRGCWAVDLVLGKE